MVRKRLGSKESLQLKSVKDLIYTILVDRATIQCNMAPRQYDRNPVQCGRTPVECDRAPAKFDRATVQCNSTGVSS